MTSTPVVQRNARVARERHREYILYGIFSEYIFREYSLNTVNNIYLYVKSPACKQPSRAVCFRRTSVPVLGFRKTNRFGFGLLDSS